MIATRAGSTGLTPVAPLPRGGPDGLPMRLAVGLLYFALLAGSGAYEELRPSGPTKVAGFAFILTAAILLLSKRNFVGSLVVPLPFLAFLVLMVASYGWSNDPGGFLKATERDVALAIGVVVALQLLPVAYVARTIIRAGYVAIALIFVTLALHPDRAYQAGIGIHGGFLHKNAMAPSLLLTLCAVLAFEPRRLIRGVTFSLVLGLILAGRSTTGLAAFIVISALAFGFRRLPEIRRASGRIFHFVIGVASIVAVALFWVLSSSLVSLAGKDPTLSKRTVIWKSINEAISHKFLHGYGWGVWSNILVEPGVSIEQRLGFFLRVVEAHNLALELLLRLGLVGLILYAVQLISTMRVGFKLLRGSNPLGVLIVLYVVLVLTFGFSEAFPSGGLWVGLLAGLAAVAIRQDRQLRHQLGSHAQYVPGIDRRASDSEDANAHRGTANRRAP